MKHIVYKTTNILNNKYYIGVHTCKCKSCQYLGSGKALLKAVKKYGRENFKVEILKTFKTREEAYNHERLLVGESEIKNSSCYNLVVGGKGQKGTSVCEKACVIDGVSYASRTEAARALEVHPSTISKWLNGLASPRKVTYRGKTYSSYAELQAATGLNPQVAYRLLSGKTKTGLVKSNTVWFIKGLIFETQKQAGLHFGVTRRCVSYWCKHREDCYPIQKH